MYHNGSKSVTIKDASFNAHHVIWRNKFIAQDNQEDAFTNRRLAGIGNHISNHK